MAIEAMTDERRDELRQAAQTVADVFAMSRRELVKELIPGTMGPDSEAELWAMTYGEPEPVPKPPLSRRLARLLGRRPTPRSTDEGEPGDTVERHPILMPEGTETMTDSASRRWSQCSVCREAGEVT